MVLQRDHGAAKGSWCCKGKHWYFIKHQLKCIACDYHAQIKPLLRSKGGYSYTLHIK